MREGVPAASTRPSATLVEMERELDALLVDYDSLSRAWPKEPRAVARAEIGRKVEDALERIGELQCAIVTFPADTLADAAVKLRRLDALLDGEDTARELLISASLLNVAQFKLSRSSVRLSGAGAAWSCTKSPAIQPSNSDFATSCH